MKSKYTSVEWIGSTLGDHNYFAAVYVAKLGVGIARDYMNFLDREGRRVVANAVLKRLIDVHAIQNVAVRLLTIAIERRNRIRRLSRMCRVGIAPCPLLPTHGARIRIDRTGHEQGRDLNIQSIHRHILKRTRTDRRAEIGRAHV